MTATALNKFWHPGPPPSVGWWPASTRQDIHVLRWWDGGRWSIAVSDHHDSEYAARKAAFAAPETEARSVKWHFRPVEWPEPEAG